MPSANTTPSKHKLKSCGSQKSLKQVKTENYSCWIKSKYGRCSCEDVIHNKAQDIDENSEEFSFVMVPKLIKVSSIPLFKYSDGSSSVKRK